MTDHQVPGQDSGYPVTVPDVDWNVWQPTERATLIFVVNSGRMLLIHKKRGLGAGKINGPGGRIEPGEKARDAAVRELREELRVEARDVSRCGQLCFQFVDGYGIHVEVFRAESCVGEPVETDEARPLWVGLDSIPYADMWPDDAHWLPLMLERRQFRGYFTFDRDKMLTCRVETTGGVQAVPGVRSGP